MPCKRQVGKEKKRMKTPREDKTKVAKKFCFLQPIKMAHPKSVTFFCIFLFIFMCCSKLAFKFTSFVSYSIC